MKKTIKELTRDKIQLYNNTIENIYEKYSILNINRLLDSQPLNKRIDDESAGRKCKRG